MTTSNGLFLDGFHIERPAHQSTQERLLDWLAAAHAESEAASTSLDARAKRERVDELRKVIGRCCCPPDKIATRGHAVPDATDGNWRDKVIYDLPNHPRGKPMHDRMAFFAEAVERYFERAYANEAAAPSDLIHVTCTGYVSPSGAQKLVAARHWPTRVTHAYHMGCYAALPALRLAAGCALLPDALAPTGPRRVDIAHTELCSLHLDPSSHSLEQLVVHSLFADGFVRYSLSPLREPRGFELLAVDEAVLPDSADSMRWLISEWGMEMTLSRDVPERIAGTVRGFVGELFRRGGFDITRAHRDTVFAVHPGGPKIIDRVAAVLELDERQVAASRAVLHDCGNMSSATLPHIWKRVLDDGAVKPGTLVASLAFGPGLTMCGALLRKHGL